MSARPRPLVEILYFDGCPNHESALSLVERLDRELGTGAEINLVNVDDRQAATRLRFLGSPTIRVDGVDVDPMTARRNDYALSCRIFNTAHGPAGQPEERWVRDALRTAAHSGPVERVLAAAAIPGSRRGTARTARLSKEERALYRWVIDRFALATPPSRGQLAEQALALALGTGAA